MNIKTKDNNEELLQCIQFSKRNLYYFIILTCRRRDTFSYSHLMNTIFCVIYSTTVGKQPRRLWPSNKV